MRNEFDDELRRRPHSEPGPSEEEYYLDDEYGEPLDGQGPVGEYENMPGASQRPGSYGQAPGGQNMFRGQSGSSGEQQAPSGYSQSRPRPSVNGSSYRNQSQSGHPGGTGSAGRGNTQAPGGQRPAMNQGGQGMFRGQSGASNVKTGSGGQNNPRTNTGPARMSSNGQSGQGSFRNQGGNGQGPSSSRNQGVAGSGQGQTGSRTQGNAGSGQGGLRNQGVTGSGQGQTGSRTQGVTGSSQGQTGSRNQGPAGGNSSRGQIVIGGGVSQQREPNGYGSQDRTAASRSAAQAGKKKKIKRAVITAIAEVFTLALIFSYAYVSRIMGTIQRPEDFNKNQVKNEVLTAEQKKHMTGYRTVAVFGVDSRDGNVNRGTNADVIMLCNVNRDTGEIRLVSVYRDTYLNISENNTYNKINMAYANGGASQALAAINKNLDLDITEYVTFNWKAVADGINLLGGVDVEITKAEFKYINSFITETVEKTGVPSVHLKSAGMNHLDGVQAVAYGRLRLMDTDFARTERQRLIIQKSFEKAKKADLGLLNRILLTEFEQIGTNLTFTDFTELILDIGKYHIGETGGFPSSRGDMKMGKKGDCVIPESLETNVTELHKFLFDKEDYAPSDAVKRISAKIAADSGNYKKGNSSDGISTDKDKKEKETTKPEKEERTTLSEETETTKEREYVVETDEEGNIIRPSESSIDGTKETKETKPGETKPGETKPGETKETKPGETKETKPGETRPEGPGPDETKPGETRPTESRPSSPEGTTESPNQSQGPGTSQTTQAHESTTEESKSAGPGGSNGPGETTASTTLSPGGQDNEVPVVSGPPGAE